MEEKINTCFSFDMLDIMISNGSYRKENKRLIWYENKSNDIPKSTKDQSLYNTFDNSEKIKQHKGKNASTQNRKKESLNISEKSNIDNEFLKDIDKNIYNNIDSIMDNEMNEPVDTDLSTFLNLVTNAKRKGKESHRKINDTKKNSPLKVQKGKKKKIINNNNDSNKKRKNDQTSSYEISENGDLLDMFSLHDEEFEDNFSEKNDNTNVENNYIDDIEYAMCNENGIVCNNINNSYENINEYNLLSEGRISNCDNYEKNEIKEHISSSNKINIKKNEEININDKLEDIDRFDKYLFEPSCIGCSNCNYYLKELTSKNYIKFCSMGEYINEGENNLLFLKNKQIQELENVNKKITKQMELFKEENINLNKKLADFKFEFIEINKKINMLINQNKLLQDINNDLTKNLQKEKQKKNSQSNNYSMGKKKVSEKDFENSIDKELFN
ncbi:conserved Plasmodium protein, unknown function [Plasmodium berghei]|uniref:Uncharacterized protein n=2 Tax=Plasmodium berghei TaxID=5821 RepID=A0A509AKY5_PLABA|nr:conserved Plasmodium protein, unknown function [Plasmodium berghei ANKA]CXI64872.1 conserved Plasmodium protein, unknown function [Plasmodium berghei]SCM23905.1 conserved Plasmodium protein, unknown function [Plasmodium berghei]SCN26831.1 conserved Plasmodium protein, unknown function [Plasmodium berghei]SCO61204.1 conserved Plasmodium protein, unknown function [Plasmodium berghei]SCO63251.1 conserved Plasmodium protein, unknown function [Plasmodium berghei]|eukprot:XP_034422448.1 conserved Plasmodium protein, unknown function [Plasmodium berghei ANKA]